jgi:hypothetical protein
MDNNKIMTRTEVFNLIDGERAYQESLDHTRTDGCAKGVGDFITLLSVYLREAEEGYGRVPGNTKSLDSIRKVAAIAVACMEAHGAPARKPWPKQS